MGENYTFSLVSKYRKALMGFAALCILIYHEWMLVFSGVPVIGKGESFAKIIGFFGVDIFFFLSAMGLVFAMQKESIWVFWLRRLKRIIIPPIVLLALKCIFDGLALKDAILCFTGYYFYTEYIYFFIWFFTAIVTVYLIFPFYFFVFEKSSNKAYFTGIVIIIWLILSIFMSDKLRYDMFGFTNRIPIIVLGVYYGWNRGWTKSEEKPSVSYKIFLLFLLVLGLFLAWKTGVNGMELVVPVSDCCIPNICITLSLIPLLVLLFERKLLGGLVVKVFGFFGSFTFELYCLQEWMGARLIPRLAEVTRYPIVINFITFVSIIFCSYLLYLFIFLLRKSARKISQELQKES